MMRSGVLLAAIVGVSLLAGSCGGANLNDALRTAPRSCQSEGYQLGFLAVSPNGRIVAFEFRHPTKGGGLGLLDWRTGRSMRLPQPVAQPSFSYDGKSLVGIIERGIAVVDFATMERAEVINTVQVNNESPHFPVFQPGTGKILYVAGKNADRYFKLLDPADHSEKVILGPEDGYYTIFRPSFVGPDEIIFEALSPRNKELGQVVKALAGPGVAVAYRLRFGGRPEILGRDLQDKTLHPDFHELASLAATPDGKTLVYIGLSATHPYTDRRQYNLEIFRLEDGQPRQMTDLRNFSSFLGLSADGSVVAFGSDPTRSKCVDLAVLDMRAGKVVKTGLLERLAKSGF